MQIFFTVQDQRDQDTPMTTQPQTLSLLDVATYTEWRDSFKDMTHRKLSITSHVTKAMQDLMEAVKTENVAMINQLLEHQQPQARAVQQALILLYVTYMYTSPHIDSTDPFFISPNHPFVDFSRKLSFELYKFPSLARVFYDMSSKDARFLPEAENLREEFIKLCIQQVKK